MIQEIIVATIIGLAVIFILRKFFLKKNESSCDKCAVNEKINTKK